MTNTPTPASSELLAHLGAVNEAVIAHEADNEQRVTTTMLGLADEVHDLVVYLLPLMPIISKTLDNGDAVQLARALVKASVASNTYKDELEASGAVKVHQSKDVLTTAAAAVAAVMNQIDPIMEVLDR